MTVKNYIDGMFETLKEIDTYSDALNDLLNRGKITSGARYYLLNSSREHFYDAFFKALDKIHNSNMKCSYSAKSLNIASKWYWKSWYEEAQKLLKVIQHTVETENFDIDWMPNETTERV
jgi:hypothetical protein